MKRFISVVLVVVMILTVCATAFAGDHYFATEDLAKTKKNTFGNYQKTTANGTPAKVKNATVSSSKGTFHLRVWKHTGWQASEGGRITGSGSLTLKSMKDGNNEFRLWHDESYYLAATHSEKSKVNSASCTGYWVP